MSAVKGKTEIVDSETFEVFSRKMRFAHFVLIITLIISHLAFWGGWHDKPSRLLTWSFGGGMSYFAFMAAFWFFRDYTIYKAKSRLLKRCYSLLLPFFTWCTLKMILTYGINIARDGSLDNCWLDILKGYLMFGREESEYFFQPANEPLWFILRLMTYFLIAPLFYYILRNKKIGMIALVACVLLVRDASYDFEGYLMPFMMGAYVSLNYRKQFIEIIAKHRVLSDKRALGAVGYVLLHCICCIVRGGLAQPPLLIGPGENFVSLYFAIIVVCELAAISVFDVPELSKDSGALTMVLYGGFYVAATVWNKIFNRLDTTISFWPGWIHTTALILFTIATLVIVYRFTKKHMPTLHIAMTGGRG